MTLTAKDFTDRRTSVAIDIDQLPAGEYVLSVDAAIGRATTQRVLRFAVE